MMKHLVLVAFTTLCLASSGLAQESSVQPQSEYGTPTSDAQTSMTMAPPAPEPDEKRSIYYKRVKGLLWLEGIAGVSSYDPDRFGSFSGLPAGAVKQRGPEFGGMAGLGLGGLTFGAVYRQDCGTWGQVLSHN